MYVAWDSFYTPFGRGLSVFCLVWRQSVKSVGSARGGDERENWRCRGWAEKWVEGCVCGIGGCFITVLQSWGGLRGVDRLWRDRCSGWEVR